MIAEIHTLTSTPSSEPLGARSPGEASSHAPGAPGVTVRRRRAAEGSAPYYLHVPASGGEGAPVLVAVHGISRNAREHASAFGAEAARLGMVTVAPVFSRRRFPAYQRLGYARRGARSAPHVALEAILDEVAEATGADTSRVFLFGFSGGAQFAHRFAMCHPQRVHALILGSAGWYTSPDAGVPYPYGIGSTPTASPIDPRAFLRVPTLVLVGEHDHERDPALNARPSLDLQQGRTRIERAWRWHGAMRALAQRLAVPARTEFGVLPRCGHDFRECVRSGGLVGRVLDFCISTARRRPTPATGEQASGACHLVFSASA